MSEAINRTISLSEIADLVGGEVLGDATITVSGICPLDEPVDGCLSFSRSDSIAKIRASLNSSSISAVLLQRVLDRASVAELPVPAILVRDPLHALTELIPLFFKPQRPAPEVSGNADIHPSALIGERVSIGAFCAIAAQVRIGDDAVIHPHVTLYEGVEVGPRTVIHAGAVVREGCRLGADTVVQNGAVIGADGFGYIPDPHIGLRAVPQVGTVVISDRVEVGANSCVDRATLGTTQIGTGSKLDNLVQVGHNGKIGQHVILCGQVGVAGSCTIGDQVVIGGSAGLADHVTVPAGTRVAGKSGIVQTLDKPGDYGGFPAIPARRWRRQLAILEDLIDNYRHIKALIKSKE